MTEGDFYIGIVIVIWNGLIYLQLQRIIDILKKNN